MVGGNIQFKTRTMTTAIMMQSNMGYFDLAIALGLVLLVISFVINSLVHLIGMVKTVIELSQVRVQYSGRTVLSIPELKLPAGRRYGLIGENGSDKSTLLKVLAQLLIPDSGTIKGHFLRRYGISASVAIYF